MSRAKAESVIKNIIREIAQECDGKGHAVSETLVAFMVKAVVLDSRNLFNVDRTLTKQDVRKLVELCVDKLMDQGSPALDTIKMQVYFDMNYTSRREFIEEHQRVLQSRLVPVSREITDSRVKTREDLEGLYHKIVSYVLLRSGLGSSTDITTVREATAALQSVFPQSELGTFMSLIKKDKEQQLNDLSMIVTGIRLFNKDSRKGGEGIDDLPAILNEAIPSTSKDIEWELELSQSLAWQYTSWLERLLDPEVETRESIVPLDMLKQALYNVRQHEAFLKVILADVILCAKQVETLQTELATRMKLLRVTVHSKTAVPTAQVFPHFTALAKFWSGLQDEMVLLSILSNIMENLQPFLAAQSQLFPDGQLEDILGSEIKKYEQRMKESSENRIDPYEIKTQEWLLPETTANFDKLPLQYNGICGYTLVKKDGLLLPGNPSIGVLKHREKYYVFSSKEAALRFGSKPDEYIAHVAEKAKQSPELIQLLQLHQQFACVTPYPEMQSGERLLVKPITKCDSSTQTDTHLLETNIVKSYEWNEWELRRKAIKLANLRSKVTHSMQTNLSHMRRDNVTQTYLLEDVACQSKRDGNSNVPKPQVYLAGLRGGKTETTHMIKTNLTRSVSE
ncbi:cilia- and flagella-associated protein 206-like isoform X1 [Salvelinus fontinalis]|uniref:cilia- and flagella-associated protein 206-like isoform X1 n=1 Tax=Salvelinus fontinalis TaxID=8038 RepID=UPI00248515E4|nr:cilia- and flagella-associated protein 206-like isoform X1 [Salvelinus fontinalis]